MIKKISYLILAFAICFMCFSSNVNALVTFNSIEYSVFDYDFLGTFSSALTDEDLIYLDNYFNNYEDDLSVCYILYYKNYDNFRIYCHADTVINSIEIRASKVRFNLNSSLTYYYNFNDFVSNDLSFTSGSNYTYFEFLYNDSSSVIGSILWFNEDSVFNYDYFSFVIEDEIYESMSSDLKKYYNFKNFMVYGQPFYSLINLRLGNWKGYTGSVDLKYCYNSVCEDTVTKTLEYKYGVDNETIILNDLLDSEHNGYKLDSTKSYGINANSTNELYVYYYTTEIDYTINYYYDDVLQKDLTEVKQASVNSIITLTDLEEVKENIYFLDKERDYSITLSDSGENVINVYYYSKDVNYAVNIYLDDIYYKSYSYVLVGKVGEEIILEDLESIINIYTLDEREYKILLTENEDLNYINVYYFSENYDTKYQDIDTSNKFYISFDWIYIKELFNLKGLYTQTEQFLIVYVVNFLFYAIVCIFGYFGLKMINKLFSLFRMF